MAQAKAPTTKSKTAVRKRAPSARKSDSERPQTPLVEWIAAAAGLIATVAVVGVIGWEALNATNGPPSIKVALHGVTAVEGGYVAELQVANRGGRPAAQVIVEGVLHSGGEEVETAETTFDYVPDNSVRHGGLFFRSDPRAASLQLRPKGFTDP